MNTPLILPHPFHIDCSPPLLVVSFQDPQRILSWTVTRPGLCVARRIVWLELRNTDLPRDVDVHALIGAKIANRGLDGVPILVTSRDIRRHHLARATVEGVTACCVATVGLSNGERVGRRAIPPTATGTINMLVHVDMPMSEAAFLETISIATEARTVAILDARVEREGALITGTGTDCVVVAAPEGDPGAVYAGLHTAIGEAVGRAVLAATAAGIDAWKEDCGGCVKSHDE